MKLRNAGCAWYCDVCTASTNESSTFVYNAFQHFKDDLHWSPGQFYYSFVAKVLRIFQKSGDGQHPKNTNPPTPMQATKLNINSTNVIHKGSQLIQGKI